MSTGSSNTKSFRKIKYSLWKYPIIAIGLLIFIARHKFKIRTIIAHRTSVGITDFSLSKVLEFGHWFVGQEFLSKW